MASRPPGHSAHSDPEHPDPARNRWLIIQIVRATGFAMILVGLLLTQGAIDLAGDNNAIVGTVLVVAGLIDGFVLPRVLARKWRSPDT